MTEKKINFVEEKTTELNDPENPNRRVFLKTISTLGTGIAVGNVLAPPSAEADESKSILSPPEGEFITTIRELENLLESILPAVHDDFAKQAHETEILQDATSDPKTATLPENGEVFLDSVEDFASRRIGFRSPRNHNRFYDKLDARFKKAKHDLNQNPNSKRAAQNWIRAYQLIDISKAEDIVRDQPDFWERIDEYDATFGNKTNRVPQTPQTSEARTDNRKIVEYLIRMIKGHEAVQEFLDKYHHENPRKCCNMAWQYCVENKMSFKFDRKPVALIP
jgi:hypothetical protein